MKLTFTFLMIIFYVNAQTISDSVNAFTIDLLTATSREPGNPLNLALSPYTVWYLLSVINEGANGKTTQQLDNVLRTSNFDKNSFRDNIKNLTNILLAKDEGANLNIYNSIFTTIEQKLKKNYQDLIRNIYGVEIHPTDFKNQVVASRKINEYITQATRNRITDFIHPEDLAYAEIFIVSALFFKGAWTSPFKQEETREETFYDEKEKVLGNVKMMYQMNFFPYSKLDWLQATAVELPYGNDNKMSMIIVLPYKGQTLQNLLQLISQSPFRRIIDKLEKAGIDYEGEDVQIYIPRFKVASDLTLNVVLQKMGITDVFDEGKADLLKMFPHYLYISRLIQRAEIEVNEEGTVASAASGASVINKMPPPKFIANKPFLYFIINKITKSIVFAGKVTVPPIV